LRLRFVDVRINSVPIEHLEWLQVYVAGISVIETIAATHCDRAAAAAEALHQDCQPRSDWALFNTLLKRLQLFCYTMTM
jgi:hypothetical protein